MDPYLSSFPRQSFLMLRAIISICSLSACGLQRLRATASWRKLPLSLPLITSTSALWSQISDFDKNSLWNGLDIQKRELYVKKKNRKVLGAFSRHPGKTGTKSFRSGIRVTKDRTFIHISRQKGVFTRFCVQTNPLPHSSEQDSLHVQLK
jgi:hypothetical protein